MKFSFELSKMPTTNQQKGAKTINGKYISYNRKGTKNTELVNNLVKYRPKVPFLNKDIPLKLSVTFYYAIKQKKKWGQQKTTRPDLDNLLKGLQDYMTKLGYYADDSQICWLEVKKFYSDKNIIEIGIKEVQHGTTCNNTLSSYDTSAYAEGNDDL